MVQTSQNLAFLAEALPQEGERVRSLDYLDGDVVLESTVGAGGEIHCAHSTPAKCPLNGVGSEPHARLQVEGVLDGCGRRFEYFHEERLRQPIVSEKGEYFSAYLRVIGLSREILSLLVLGQFERGRKQALDVASHASTPVPFTSPP